MSLIKIPDGLDIEITTDKELKQAINLLAELMCIDDVETGNGYAKTLKESMISKLATLIAIYKHYYEVPTCDHLDVFR